MARNTGYTKREGLSSNRLEKVIEYIFKANLAVKKREKVLIIIDQSKKKIGRLFFKIGKRFTDKIDLMEMPIGNVNGEEPPADVAKSMLDYDVELLITTKSLTHTEARKNASKKGARIATLPNATEAMLKRTIIIDYKKMHKIIAKIGNMLDGGEWVKITSKGGTNITFNIKGRKAHGRKCGLFLKKGDYGNLPDGEVFIAPVEGSSDGVYIVDGSLGGIGKVDKPVCVYVDRGYVTKIDGGKAADQLTKMLDNVGREAGNIAEFGIGTNENAVISGNMLEDEKVIGTCHIALGNNSGFGGKVKVPLHIDGIIKKPTIWIEDKKVIEDGRFIFYLK